MSTLKADTLVANDGTSPVTLTKQSAPKAWINANNDALVNNDSFNVSSVVDDNPGQIDVNYTNSFANDDYATTCANANGEYMSFPRLVTASDTQLASYNVDGNVYADTDRNCMICCGDLA
jgi:hypothetical protein